MPQNTANNMPSVLSRVEVVQLVYTFSCGGSNEDEVRRNLSTFRDDVTEKLKKQCELYNDESALFSDPHLCHIWSLPSSSIALDWCGSFKLVFYAKNFNQKQGVWFKIEQYKTIMQQVSRIIHQTILFHKEKAPEGFWIHEKPFTWTVAVATDPEVEWTEDNIAHFGKSLVALAVVRTPDWQHYTQKAIRDILDTNLAYTTQELQLLHYNSGFLFAKRERWDDRSSINYLHSAVIEPNEVLKTIRFFATRFRRNLHQDTNDIVTRRQSKERLSKVIRKAVNTSQMVLSVLHQVDEHSLNRLQEISHRKFVFSRLLERYSIKEVCNGLREQARQLNEQITEMNNELQSSKLRFINIFVAIPVAIEVGRIISKFFSNALYCEIMCIGLCLSLFLAVYYFISSRKDR